MRFRQFFPIALLVASLSACQPLPQPFSHTETGRTAPLDLPDSGGIVVLEVAEAPPATSAALAQAMAEALAERNVPAGTGTGNRNSHFLQGSVEKDGRNTVIVWTLYNPQGDIVKSVRKSLRGVPVNQWSEAQPELMTRIAREAAPAIAGLLQGISPDENIIPPLYVAEVTGAPGLGNRQLRGAVRRHLDAAGLEIANTPGSNRLTVVGLVTVSPATRGQQMATLEWRVIDEENAEVGKISQSNPIAEGSLDGSWGPVADFAGQGAAQGVNALVRRIKWRTDKAVKAEPDRPPS